MSVKSKVALHPSNRLYHGECRDFRDAIQTYIAALRYELSLFGHESAFDRESRAMFEKCIAESEGALREYAAVFEAAEEALFKRWAQSESEELRRIGECGLEGDYTPLAI